MNELTNTQDAAPKRGRPRKNEVQQERRRRSDHMSGGSKRLICDEAKLDRENYAYRWINDTGDRVHQMTKMDDWDIVEGAAAGGNEETGTGTTIRAGTQDNGAALRSVLVRKPKEFAVADEAAKQRKIDETEQGMKRPSQDNQYAADGMTISR